MNNTNTSQTNQKPDSSIVEKYRRAVTSKEPDILSDIYQEQTNIAIWQRNLTNSLKSSVAELLSSNSNYQTAMSVSPQSVISSLNDSFGSAEHTELSENIAELVDMFCCLFDLNRAGLRLVALDKAMCPKFHVDRVPCRLVSTFQGEATEWLYHQDVDRTKLGSGSNGLPDNESGLFHEENQIQKLNCGDVALLKGEIWQDNDKAGLVHRSPTLVEGEKRLLLTLDFIN